jgi:hypothetical protein
MAFDVVNVGTLVNDGTGDTLRNGGIKINNNFAKAVEGPASATADGIPVFSGTSGKLLKSGTGAVIDSSGNLSVGTTSLLGKVAALVNFGNATAANFVASAAGTAQGELAGYSFRSTFQGTGDNTPRRSADIWSGFDGGNWGTEFLAFGVGNNSAANDSAVVSAEKMRINASGNVSIANGNLVIGTAGKGIDFSADPNAAGMTSELLDDYEEGTWTPDITFGGNNVSLTFAVRTGVYTKIGNCVYISGLVALSNKGTSTGTAVITGLPFTSFSTNVRPRIQIGYYLNTGNNPRDGFVPFTSTAISLSFGDEIQFLTNADFQNDTELWFSGFYFAS